VAQGLQEPAAMAAVAYRIYDARPQGNAVQALHQVVTAEVCGWPLAFPAGCRRPASRRDGSRRRTSWRRGDDGGNSNGLCFYHNNFGPRASRCRSPCGWQGNGPAADGSDN
jgi:hypothetical protein